MKPGHTMFALLVVLGSLSAVSEALIGLRPAPKTPAPPHQPRHVVSPRPTQLHPPNSNWQVPPYENFSEPIAGRQPSDTGHRQTCRPVSLLRCGYRLLRQSIQGDVLPCQRIESFTTCVTESLRAEGRKEFVIGMSYLHDLYTQTDKLHDCGSNTTNILPAHTRHQRSKRGYATSGQDDPCCSEEIVNCSIQTYLKITTNLEERCPLMNYFETCLHDAEPKCTQVSMTHSISLFTSQLQRLCLKGINRRRRKRFV